MSHSHIPVQHLLKQVELFRTRRGQRDVRPAWLSRFIDRAAELFEPFSEVARVGFESRLAEDCWEVGLYLGSIEMVGGKEDGRSHNSSFQYDLGRLLDLFQKIECFRWFAYPESEQVDREPEAIASSILIEGLVEGAPLRVMISSTPPTGAGPGLRQFPNGRRETV